MEKTYLGSKKRILLIALICFTLILSVSSTVLANSGPAFSNVFPVPDSVMSSGKLTISLTANDPDNVVATSVVMKVDGVQVKPFLAYSWIADYIEDMTTLDMYYPATLSNGTHTVEVSVKDRLGNLSDYSWSFTVGQAPKIYSFTPQDGSVVTEKRPVISAVVNGVAAIDSASVLMAVNGTKVPAGFDAITGKVTYIPATDLVNETVYTIVVSARDTSGNTSQAQWKFTVNTYTGMPVPVSDATCLTCHSRATHPMDACNKCHGVNLSISKPTYPLDDCYLCHFGSSYPSKYHLDGLPKAMGVIHPVQTTDSCVECHAKNWSSGIPRYHDPENTAERHRTTTTGCEKCHSVTLTSEHQQRKDDQGNNLDCFTCHSSTEPGVINAIKAKDTSCSACHDLGADGGHPAHDNNGLDAYCQTCHSDSILTEPQFHKQNDCNVCHGPNAGDIVKNSINTKDTNCFSCHNQGHNVNFVQMIPADIPQYPGFRWTVPQDATIFSGEIWFKADYNTAGAKIVISERLPSVSGTDVFTWYQQKTAEQGWTKTEGPTQGSNNYSVTYSKGIRKLTVYFYGGETRDPSSKFVGYRLELLYK